MNGFTSESEDSAFQEGAGIMIETADGGLEVGDLVGVSPFGIVFRASHQMTTREVTDKTERAELLADVEDGVDGEITDETVVTKSEMTALSRPVLTMLPWSEIKKIELASEVMEAGMLQEFRDALDLEDGLPADLALDEDLDTDLDEDEETDGPGE